MKVLIDTNIILDIALAREPFLINSKLIIEQLLKTDYIAYVTATTITDIYYVIKKQKGAKFAKSHLLSLLKIVNILGIDQKVIFLALESDIIDFEDAVQSTSAQINNIDFIISRNTKDFAKSKIKAVTPEQFLTLILK